MSRTDCAFDRFMSGEIINNSRVAHMIAVAPLFIGSLLYVRELSVCY